MTGIARLQPALVASALLAPLCASAATLRVPDDYATIQAALDAAAAGDSVVVGPGVYDTTEFREIPVGSGRRRLTAIAFLKEGVALIGEQGSAATILDLSDAEDVPYLTGVAGSFVGAAPPIQGFTIRGRGRYGNSRGMFLVGPSVVLRDLLVWDCELDEGGYVSSAGLYYYGDELLVEHCTFRDCAAANYGGAMQCTNTNVTIRDSFFQGCRAYGAGAVLIDTVPPRYGFTARIERCSFQDNVAGSGGALMISAGQAILPLVEIRDCLFRNNQATESTGGAIECGTTGVTVIRVENCLFDGNRAGVWPSSYGGAMAFWSGRPEILGNTFYNCRADDFGSAIFLQISAFTKLHGNVFVSCPGAAAVVAEQCWQFQSACNIFWDNPDGEAEGFALAATDRVLDPLFCDASAHDFTVQQGSPCLDEAWGACGRIGAFGQGCGPVSIEPTTWGQVKTIFR